jgi:hypothetical protein
MIYLLLLLCAVLGILGLTYALYGILRTWRQLERRIAPYERAQKQPYD